MNTAFGNPQGDPHNIDWNRVRKQFSNIGDEFVELLNALGACNEDQLIDDVVHKLTSGRGELRGLMAIMDAIKSSVKFPHDPVLDDVRDASRDIVVFADGGHHLMGYDGDVDMRSVIDGVMTRFVKDEADLHATIQLHGNKGVWETRVEGNYPTMILKSTKDQPDAPVGKFLKSASYSQPVFYQVAPKV